MYYEKISRREKEKTTRKEAKARDKRRITNIVPNWTRQSKPNLLRMLKVLNSNGLTFVCDNKCLRLE